MSRSTTVLGFALALTVGIQAAEASSCIDHQVVDKLGQVVRDANGHAVPCGLDPSAGDRVGPRAPETRVGPLAIKGFIWALEHCWSAAASRRRWRPLTTAAAARPSRISYFPSYCLITTEIPTAASAVPPAHDIER